MDISELAKTAEADAAAAEARAKAEVAGFAKIWNDSKAIVIAIAAAFLFIGFALGRASCRL